MLYPGILLTTEVKTRKKNSQGSRKVPVVYGFFLCRYSHLLRGSLDKSVDPGLSWNALGNLSQPSVSLYICRVGELGVSPTQANFDSDLSVRLLMWPVKNGSLKSL